MTEGYAFSLSGSPGSCYDDEEEVQSRILTTEEIIERLRNREDFLSFDTNRRLRISEAIALVCAIITGLWLSEQEINVAVHSDFLEHGGGYSSGSFSRAVIDRPQHVSLTQRTIARTSQSVSLRTHVTHNGSTGGGGTGSVTSRVAKMGIFSALSKSAGKVYTGGELLARGGYAKGIDKILSGLNGLQKGSGGSVDRKGFAGIGDGPGIGSSGFDGTGAGVDDLIGNLMAAQSENLNLKENRAPPRILTDLTRGSAAFKGGRSRSSIMAVVLENISSLRYSYNKRLREKPGIKGNVRIRFSIDEFGRVIFCDVIGSTVNDPEFEQIICAMILKWRFEKIDKPGDITEIVYPFTFSS